jgi:PAS domain-containing protein
LGSIRWFNFVLIQFRQQNLAQNFEQVSTQGVGVEFKVEIVCLDKQLRSFYCLMDPIPYERSNFGAILIMVCTSVFGAYAVETWLLDQVDQAIICTNLEGTILFWNKKATSLYGWTKEEVIGKVVQSIPSKSAESATIIFQDYLLKGKTWQVPFYLKVKKPGRIRSKGKR